MAKSLDQMQEDFVTSKLIELERSLVKNVDKPLDSINQDIVKKVSSIFSKYKRYPVTVRFLLIEKELRKQNVYRQISRRYGEEGKSFTSYLKGSLDDNFRETVKHTQLTLKAHRKQAEEFEGHYKTVADIEDVWRQKTSKHSAKVNDIISQGIAKHKSIDMLTEELLLQTDLQVYQAKRLARTEVMNVINQASLLVYKEAKIGYVKWLDATEQVQLKSRKGNTQSRVCPFCRGYANGGENKDGVYPIGKLPSQIPAHPNCRCTLAPVLKTTKK